MIEYSLQIACQILHCKKHQLKYWQSHLDPNEARHGYSFRALIGFRLVQFLIEDCNYSVRSLKKSEVMPLVHAIETCPEESKLRQLWLVFNYRQHRFELAMQDCLKDLCEHRHPGTYFVVTNVDQLFMEVWTGFKSA